MLLNIGVFSGFCKDKPYVSVENRETLLFFQFAFDVLKSIQCTKYVSLPVKANPPSVFVEYVPESTGVYSFTSMSL